MEANSIFEELNKEANEALKVTQDTDPLDTLVWDQDRGIYISKRELAAEAQERKEEALKRMLENVFVPNWNNKPEELPPALSLNGVSILTSQNLTAVIAPPGAGKSSLSEAACAWHLNFQADALGFEGDENFKGVIYCDFERTNTDVWNSFNRMAKRAGIPFGQEPSKVTIVGMRSIPRLTERMQAIEYFLDNNPCSLLLLDGAGDLVTDTNDLAQAIDCRIWLRELTVKYKLSIFTTLHPNPGSDKPRGHIGSEICREAECVFLAKKMDGDIHILTTSFEHGKNRNSSDLTAAYKWNDNAMMFLTATVPDEYDSGNRSGSKRKLPEASDISESTHVKVLQDVFKHQEEQTSEEFLTNFCAAWNNTESGGGEMKKTRAKGFRSYYILNDYLVAKTGQKGNRTVNTIADPYRVGFYKPLVDHPF